jgi:rubredoxin
MDLHKCTICGYFYYPDQGDPSGGIEIGTRFQDIPEGWLCLICGASFNLFVPG